jgi:multidrug efflux pump subunit AcrA (membrane-fusion protein)
MSRFQIIAGGVVVALLFAAAGYAGYRISLGDETIAPRNPSTVAVTRGDVNQTVVAPGRAVGTGEVVLGMSIGGRLATVGVRPGSVVARGDVVARLDTAPLEAAVEDARLQRDRGALGDPQLARIFEDAEEALIAAELKAPFDGVVLTVTAVPGMAVSPFEGFIRMADPRALEVRTTVIEEDLPLVRAGQPVEVFFDAAPDAATEGLVSRVVPRRVQGEPRPLYHVYIDIASPPDQIVSGMTADASIVVAQRSDVLRLPRAIVRAGSGGTARVEVWSGGVAEERTVEIGLRGDVSVEIVSGLAEGERVVAD